MATKKELEQMRAMLDELKELVKIAKKASASSKKDTEQKDSPEEKWFFNLEIKSEFEWWIPTDGWVFDLKFENLSNKNLISSTWAAVAAIWRNVSIAFIEECEDTELSAEDAYELFIEWVIKSLRRTMPNMKKILSK